MHHSVSFDFSFSLDPRERHTVWGLTIGAYFTWITIYGVNQSQVQRYLTVPRIQQARKYVLFQATTHSATHRNK